MTTNEWLAYAKEHRLALESLIKMWHPRRRPDVVGDMNITAAASERACEVVRDNIKIEQKDKPDPVEYFNNALDRDDWPIVNQILNDTWFGVPESRDAWNIRGFKESVHLIEEPPE